MEFQTKIQRVTPDPGQRLIVVSDIHGHQAWLERLLARVGFSKKDMLILVGDFIEKGPESLKTVRYIMDLQKDYQVLPLMGNVDLWRLEMLLCEDGSLDEAFYNTHQVLTKIWKRSFYGDLCQELGMELHSAADVSAVRKAALERFEPELNFLKELPTILETPDFVFVHGGLVERTVEENRNVSPAKLLKNDSFLTQGKTFDKYVVVGHWPVGLYDRKIDCSAPIIRKEQKIIAIDGGCGLKTNGQLNALLILPDGEITWEAYHEFKTVTALTDQEPSKDSVNILYNESDVKILEAGPEFSFAEQLATGERLWIANPYLDDPPKAGELNKCWEYTNYRLPVKAGEKLSLILKTSQGCLMKKRGITGWYCGSIEE